MLLEYENGKSVNFNGGPLVSKAFFSLKQKVLRSKLMRIGLSEVLFSRNRFSISQNWKESKEAVSGG
jgi:hypothetical protein